MPGTTGTVLTPTGLYSIRATGNIATAHDLAHDAIEKAGGALDLIGCDPGGPT